MSTGHPIKVRLLLLGMAASYLLALAMAVSPALHHWVHQDSDESIHHCVVTALADAQVDSPTPGSIFAAPLPQATVSLDLPRDLLNIAIFSAGFPLEHAPPVA